MNVSEVFDILKSMAKNDPDLKAKLLDTQNAKFPLSSFCSIATDLGYELFPMDVIEYGESAYAAMRRATNGGGENAPMLEGEDDYYELFMTELEEL